MLNLSDKDLDRLSRDAAGEYDPGDIVGPRSWEKLEMQLDRHLGHITPRHVRGFHRLPFYYAPVVLLLVGASYYFIKNHKTQKDVSSGSPPLTLVKPAPTSTDKRPASSQNPVSTDKSTSTLVIPPATTEQPAASAAGAGSHRNLASGSSATPGSASSATSGSASNSLTPGSGSSATSGSASSATPGSASNSLTPGSSRTPLAPGTASNDLTPGSAAGITAARNHKLLTHHHPMNGTDRSIPSAGSTISAAGKPAKPAAKSKTSDASAAISPDDAPLSSGRNLPLSSGRSLSLSTGRSLSFSTVRGPVPIKHSGRISDSALRAFTAKAMPTPIQRKGGTYVNRSLQIGILLAPDFSSVSSMSGDKPGSSIGLTADYQFAHRWYVGTGLLFSRKNYAAAPANYHPPKNYYSLNGMNNIDFVKGSFNMLEIPLNLRYDFSVTGNTLFFATAGLSSYLKPSENCNFYYTNFWPRQDSKNIHYKNEPNYLFSALDLSLGVEMGINNNLSVLVAPYVKVPVRNIGFGQVELSSVGINFILEFTPVLSRKR